MVAYNGRIEGLQYYLTALWNKKAKFLNNFQSEIPLSYPKTELDKVFSVKEKKSLLILWPVFYCVS